MRSLDSKFRPLRTLEELIGPLEDGLSHDGGESLTQVYEEGSGEVIGRR